MYLLKRFLKSPAIQSCYQCKTFVSLLDMQCYLISSLRMFLCLLLIFLSIINFHSSLFYSTLTLFVSSLSPFPSNFKILGHHKLLIQILLHQLGVSPRTLVVFHAGLFFPFFILIQPQFIFPNTSDPELFC